MKERWKRVLWYMGNYPTHKVFTEGPPIRAFYILWVTNKSLPLLDKMAVGWVWLCRELEPERFARELQSSGGELRELQ